MIQRYVSILFLAFCLDGCFSSAMAQQVIISEPININSDEGYALSPKINDRYLFFSWQDENLRVQALDNSLRNIWTKEIVIEKKADVKVIDVIPNKNSFSVIARMRKKGNNFIKVLKFDGQVKLLDSATICNWRDQYLDTGVESLLSEDKHVMLVYNSGVVSDRIACTFSLDSLKPIWVNKIKKISRVVDETSENWTVTNEGKAFFITSENGSIKNTFQFDVVQYNTNNTITNFKITTGEFATSHVKFSYDNRNKRLLAVGGYSNKNSIRVNGIYFLTLPITDLTKGVWQTTPFTDEFVTSFTGKKTTDNKGLSDLKIQRIIHRSDGGAIAFVEQMRAAERITTSNGFNFNNPNVVRTNHSFDYYYDNLFSIAFDSLGGKEWSQVHVKKQTSQDDDGRFSSFVLMRNQSALRMLFNEEVSRNTNVYEYTIGVDGTIERHVVLSTEGKDLNLRLRDALQTGSSELIVPSENQRRIKLVRIAW